jgi:hypothetical protein
MPEVLTDAELVEIEARVTAARPGPWWSSIEGRDHAGGESCIQVGEGADRSEDIELGGATEADQDFIAAARQDIPRLIATIRALTAGL